MRRNRPRPRDARSPRARMLVILGLVAVWGAAVPASSRPVAPRAPGAPASPRILVMPFDDVNREGKIYWVAEASSILLAEDLRALGRNPISRQERTQAFERLSLPLKASLSDATMIRVAELLGANETVIGSLVLEGEELVVRARSIRLDTGRVQAEAVERGKLADLFPLFGRVALRLYGAPGQAAPNAASDAHAPLFAFENYVKGLLAETPASQVKFLQAALAQRERYDAARLALWHAWAGQSEHARAIDAVKDVPAESRFSREARFLTGISELQLKRYDAAFATWKSLLTPTPLAPALNNMGVVQLRRVSSPQTGAVSYYFDKAREQEGADADYYFNLGYAYVMERDPQAAIYWLREAVRRDPTDGVAHWVLGALLLSTGASAEGTREKELAHRLSSEYAEWDRRPASDPIPRGLERVKETLVRPVPSDLAFVTTEQRDQRELATFHLERARRLFEQEHDREAATELRRAVYLSPYHAEAHLLLGRIYIRSGQLREAIDELKVSLWSEATAPAHAALAEAYLQAHEDTAARTEAQRALALDPKSEAARKVLAKLPPGRP